MNRRARWRRFLLRTATIFLLLGTIVCVGLRSYLQTQHAARLAASQLGRILQTTATIDSLQGNLVADSSVAGLRTWNANDPRPVLEARQAVVNLSVWKALWGKRLPDRIDLRGVHVRLRFDRRGNLLSRLPVPPRSNRLPIIRLRAARITFEQEGRAPFSLDDISVTLSSHRKENLFGVIDDPVWGPLDLTGRFDDDKLTVSLQKKDLALTPAMLRSLPFVPQALWRQFEVEGPSVGLKLDVTLQKPHPQVRYRIGFERARVRLLQRDRPSFEVGPVRASVAGSEDGARAEGRIEDPYWGTWNVGADIDSGSGNVMVQLDTREVEVNPKKLHALPFVPKGVWKHVRASGRTPALVRIQLHTVKPDVRYRVELAPRDTSVRVASIDLEADHASGLVFIEDSRVWLRQVRGQAAGGTIATESDLDFRGDGTRMHFDVDVRQLELKKLPAKWELPRQIEGKVTGKARLTVTVENDDVSTHGTGSGQIEEAKLIGFRTREPIPLNLRADGKRFHFLPRLAQIGSWLPGLGGRSKPVVRIPVSELVGRFSTAAGQVGEAIVRHTGSVLARFGQLRHGEDTVLDTRFGLDDVDLGQVVRQAGLVLPIDVAGRVSFQVHLSIPVNSPSDLTKYHLRGTARAARLEVAGVVLTGLEIGLRLDEGRLDLHRLVGAIHSPSAPTDPGRFSGVLRGQLVSGVENRTSGIVACSLDLTRVPTDAVARLLPQDLRALAGRLSGQVKVRLPLDGLRDPASWHGTVRLTCPRLSLPQVVLQDVRASVSLEDGVARVRELRAEAAGGTVRGDGMLTFANEQPFRGQLIISEVDLAGLPGLGRVAPAGTLAVTADLVGALATRKFAVKGTIRGTDVQVAGLKVGEVTAGWGVDPQRIEVKDLRARICEGELTGTVWLDPEKRSGQMELFLADLDASSLARSLIRSRLQIAGKISGQASGLIRVVDNKPDITLNLDLASAKLAVAGIPARKLRGRLDTASGKLRYELEGETLNGKFSLEGKYPPPPFGAVSTPHGWLRLERIRLGPLWDALGLAEQLRPLAGVVALSIPFRHDGRDDAPVGRGKFEIRELRWRDGELSDVLRGEVRVGVDSIFLRDVSGVLAGGMLRAAGAYRFDDPSRGWFDLRVSGADPSRLSLIDAESRELIQGSIDVQLRGNPGPEWRASGSLGLARGKVLGVEVSDWRLPVEVNMAPGRGQIEVNIRESTAQVGYGRAQFRASARYSGSWRVEGSLQLFDAGLRSLAGMLGDVTTFARGRLSGRIDFSGSEMRSAADLTANLHATLQDAQIFQLPVLRLMVPYILPGGASVDFHGGEMRGRLAGGVFRIAEFTLDSNLVQLLVQGSVTLQGRLDVEVTAHTSSPGVNPLLLRLLLQRLPPVGPVPVGLVFRATELLADRIVRVRLSGTIKSPQVQVEPIRLLSEQAVRFFLMRAVRSAR